MRGPKPAPLDIPHSDLVDAAKFRYLLSEPLLNVATGRARCGPRMVHADMALAAESPESRRRRNAAAALGFATAWEAQQIQARRRYLSTPPNRRKKPRTPPRWNQGVMIQRLSEKMLSPTHSPSPDKFRVPASARLAPSRPSLPATQHALPPQTTKATNAPRWTGTTVTGDALDDFMHCKSETETPTHMYPMAPSRCTSLCSDGPLHRVGRAVLQDMPTTCPPQTMLLTPGVPLWPASLATRACGHAMAQGNAMRGLAGDAVDALMSAQAAR